MTSNHKKIMTIAEAGVQDNMAAAVAGVPAAARPFMQDNIALRQRVTLLEQALGETTKTLEQYAEADKVLLPIMSAAVQFAREYLRAYDRHEGFVSDPEWLAGQARLVIKIAEAAT